MSKKRLAPLRVVIQVPVEIDMNEVLAGMKTNTDMRRIRQSVGAYLRNTLGDPLTPGDTINIPEVFEIIMDLKTYDLISTDYGDEE